MHHHHVEDVGSQILEILGYDASVAHHRYQPAVERLLNVLADLRHFFADTTDSFLIHFYLEDLETRVYSFYDNLKILARALEKACGCRVHADLRVEPRKYGTRYDNVLVVKCEFWVEGRYWWRDTVQIVVKACGRRSIYPSHIESYVKSLQSFIESTDYPAGKSYAITGLAVVYKHALSESAKQYITDRGWRKFNRKKRYVVEVAAVASFLDLLEVIFNTLYHLIKTRVRRMIEAAMMKIGKVYGAVEALAKLWIGFVDIGRRLIRVLRGERHIRVTLSEVEIDVACDYDDLVRPLIESHEYGGGG